jgi:hypothetical protein
MKVYSVFSVHGEMDHLDKIFSSREKAHEYMRHMKKTKNNVLFWLCVEMEVE